MKLNGKEISGANKVTLVLPRETGDDIVLTAEAIMDMSAIDKYLAQPQPKKMMGKGGEITFNHSDPQYKTQLISYEAKRVAWLVLESLRNNDIEWETVDMENPSTWSNYNEELTEAGFSAIEVGRICGAVMQANSLDEAKLEAARAVFLRGQEKAAGRKSSGQSS